MAIIPAGVNYDGGGRLYHPNGNLLLEFDPRINPVIHDLFSHMSELVGLNVDLSGLPDSFEIDGVVYPVHYIEDVKQEAMDLISVWATEFGWEAAKTRRVVRPIVDLLAAMIRENWF